VGIMAIKNGLQNIKHGAVYYDGTRIKFDSAPLYDGKTAATTDDLSSAGIPAGTIIKYSGGMSLNGFLLCNSAEVSRSLYASLYSAIGTRFGSGDGATTFNLPSQQGNSGYYFYSIGSEAREWRGMAGDSLGNVYACVYGGDIYIKNATSLEFSPLLQAPRNWISICCASSGNVYACVYGGDIYRRVGGAGDFIAMEQGDRNWRSITQDGVGNIYSSVYGGDIYKLTNETGNFAGISTTSRNWSASCNDDNGNVFFFVYGSSTIYAKNNGSETVSTWASAPASRNWSDANISYPENDMFVVADNADGYFFPKLFSDGRPLNLLTSDSRGIASDIFGCKYISINNGEIVAAFSPYDFIKY
jgi:hypothetical protein